MRDDESLTGLDQAHRGRKGGSGSGTRVGIWSGDTGEAEESLAEVRGNAHLRDVGERLLRFRY